MSIAIVTAIIDDIESRSKWDKLFVGEVLETRKHYKVVYWSVV